MKLNLLLCSVLLAAGGLCAVPVSAQDTNAAPSAPPAGGPGDHQGRGLDFLSPQEKAQYLKDRQAVLESNPNLKSQADELKTEGESLRGGNATLDQRKEFREKRRAFDEAVNQAILKQDPSAKPILDKIAAHMQEMKAKFGGGAGGAGNGGSNSSSSQN